MCAHNLERPLKVGMSIPSSRRLARYTGFIAHSKRANLPKKSLGSCEPRVKHFKYKPLERTQKGNLHDHPHLNMTPSATWKFPPRRTMAFKRCVPSTTSPSPGNPCRARSSPPTPCSKKPPRGSTKNSACSLKTFADPIAQACDEIIANAPWSLRPIPHRHLPNRLRHQHQYEPQRSGHRLPLATRLLNGQRGDKSAHPPQRPRQHEAKVPTTQIPTSLQLMTLHA